MKSQKNQKCWGKDIDKPHILWYHFGMDRQEFRPGDKIYWEMTDAQGRTFYGIGRLEVDVSLQWLEDFAMRMHRPVFIGIRKLEDGADIHVLDHVTACIPSGADPRIAN
jgi:hypothetical protein